ncbi:hypothetical protein GOBAR_AA28631 [Gossypium barbadense]|uniref:Uncharacterized protein n=1 Tax=Gossypium barbadense TaxID=3634 RepID=A0A2P5WLV8_GOSBA|nr:hypothetical protein GOBAR_AA28631 [Gossypium barbadense]
MVDHGGGTMVGISISEVVFRKMLDITLFWYGRPASVASILLFVLMLGINKGVTHREGCGDSDGLSKETEEVSE